MAQRCIAHAARSDARCLNWPVRGSTLCHAHGGRELVERAPEPQGVPVTSPQLRYLHGMFRRCEVGHDNRHAYASSHLGRPISSLSELSMAEASRLLDELEREQERQDREAAGLGID
jgi:hypothetical protein